MTTDDGAARSAVSAALRLWGREPSASLGRVAAEAGMGRTTLHRAFPDRAALRAAVDTHVQQRCAAAADRAELGRGTAREALARLAVELLQDGDVLRFVVADDGGIAPGRHPGGDGTHDQLLALFRRGLRQGEFDPALDPEWMLLSLWLLLHGAALLHRHRHVGLRDAQQLALRTLDQAFRAQART